MTYFAHRGILLAYVPVLKLQIETTDADLQCLSLVERMTLIKSICKWFLEAKSSQVKLYLSIFQ